jgi:hypothetical protein
MNANLILALAPCALIAAAGSPAQARQRVNQISVVAPTAPDGVTTMGPYSTLRDDCTVSSFARVTILSTPRKGAVVVNRERGDPNFFGSNSFSKCNGREVEGTMVQYQAYKGARGTDPFRFRIVFENGETRIVTAKIVIR